MSIHCYTGVPGSGKSAHVASDIRFQLTRRYPRPVIANFNLGNDAPVKDEVRKEYFTYLPNSEMSAERIWQISQDFWAHSDVPFQEDYITLVLDECQLLFNSRLWGSKDRLSYLEFLSQSRKAGVKVILIAQHTKMIDNQFRMLIEVEHNHRRVQSLPVIGHIINAIALGHLFVDVRYLYQINERLGMSLLWLTKDDYAMYDSYDTFERRTDT